MKLRSIPIRRIGSRDSLFLGCDRELIMFSGLIAGCIVFASPGLKTALLGISLWMFSLYTLRFMAKADPKQRQIYLRQLKYLTYYPARSTPFRLNTTAQGNQYK